MALPATPWTSFGLNDADARSILILDANGDTVAELETDPAGQSAAALIVAASAMLAALKSAEDAIFGNGAPLGSDTYFSVRTALRAGIVAAEGVGIAPATPDPRDAAIAGLVALAVAVEDESEYAHLRDAARAALTAWGAVK